MKTRQSRRPQAPFQASAASSASSACPMSTTSSTASASGPSKSKRGSGPREPRMPGDAMEISPLTSSSGACTDASATTSSSSTGSNGLSVSKDFVSSSRGPSPLRGQLGKLYLKAPPSRSARADAAQAASGSASASPAVKRPRKASPKKKSNRTKKATQRLKTEDDSSDSDVCFVEERPPAKRVHTDGNAAAADSLISAQPKREQRHSHQQLDNYPRGPVLSLNHLEFVSTIGKGGFGRVFLVRPKANNPVGLSPEKCLALKTIKKSRLASNKTELKHTRVELRTHSKLPDHPFIVRFVGSFQSPERIFFLTEFLPGGELFSLLCDKAKMKESDARFYLSELVLAVEFLHSHGIIYRDMKPENVMIDAEGHCKLIDFGLARDDMRGDAPVQMTFCGTKEYMAPEVFVRGPYNHAADWWSLGAVGYDMIAGEFPYQPGDYNTPIRYDPSVFSNVAASFISKLLMKNPKHRLGATHLGGATGIKRANFFRGVNWNQLYRRASRPPFVPRLQSPGDVKYFDKDFVSQPPTLSVTEPASPANDNDMFKGFDYIHPGAFGT